MTAVLEHELRAGTTTPATDTKDTLLTTPALIRVAVLDDHAVVRAGLEAMFAPEPDTTRGPTAV